MTTRKELVAALQLRYGSAGLAVVKAVAESHGGTVSTTSAGPGTGSEFTLRLPIVLERRMAGEPA